MPSADATYNGWPSYETWLVVLWLDNDPGTEAFCRKLVAQTTSVGEAADVLKGYLEEESPLTEQSGLYVDLLTAALGHVNFRAVAAHFREQGS
jgi:hypothetical protein